MIDSKKMVLLLAMIAGTAVSARPIFTFEANAEKKLPENVKVVKKYAPNGITWTDDGTGKFAIDTDGMPKKGAPLTIRDPRIDAICTAGFTVEIKFKPRLRKNNPNYGKPKHSFTNEILLNLGSAYAGKGFFVKIFNNDLGFGVQRKQWSSMHINYNLANHKDQWMDMAFVYDPVNKYLAIYKDGKLVRRKAIKEQGHLCKSSLYIGGEASNWTFDGLISKIVLTPRAKSAQELSNAGKEIQKAAKKLEDL